MRKFLKNINWPSIIILASMAAFAVVRMQTVQAVMLKQIETKHQIDKQNIVRELDLIHKSLERIEGKLDNVISSTHKTNPGNGRNYKPVSEIRAGI